MNTQDVVMEFFRHVGIGRRISKMLFGLIEEPKEKPQKIFLLDDLKEIGKSKLKDIALKTGHSPQNLCFLYNHLEKEGLIKREIDPTDRRNTLYSITDKGDTILEENKRKAREVVQHLFSQLSDQDLKTMKESFEKINLILEKIV